MTEVIPDKLGHYEVIRKIASGGMGDVYLARDSVLGRLVAIKVLPADVTSNPDRLARFRREARAASALNHPNILTIHEYGQEADLHFFVTEYLTGGTVRQMISRGASIEERLAVASAIAAALVAAHGASVVHRDIKPDNVMITEQGLVKVLDFGLAKVVQQEEVVDRTDTPTLLGQIVGTLPYMAPEQIRAQQVDGRTDVFSLGVTLFELFEGRRPFVGQTTHDVTAAILTRDAPPARRASEISNALSRLIERMLAKEREERPDAREVLCELEVIRQNLDRGVSRLRTTPSQTVSTEALAVKRVLTTNLPAEVTALLGRERDVDRLCALLRRSDVRLVTITGAGGTGKTRLATRVAAELNAEFTDGAWLVPLETADSPDLIPSLIAQTLGVRELAGQKLSATLGEHLRRTQMLLVIDNFEHVVSGATLIAELLSVAPQVKVLATSQVRLHIRAEHEYPLDPLQLPQPHSRADELRRNPAVALFVERAQHVSPDFALTEKNADEIAEICRVLDGLPLAIELAAVRVKLLTLATIRARLQDPIKFLTGGPSDLPPRQQALQNTVQWSVHLLDEPEQKLFARLSIFSGGATVESISGICDLDEAGESAVAETLASLLDKSLVRREWDAAGDPRFTMLAAIRAVASQRVAAAGEHSRLADRHLAFFVALGQQLQSTLTGSAQPVTLRRIDAEHANIRTALSWAIESGHVDDGLRLASSIWRFWETRGLWREGRFIIDTLLRTGLDVDSRVRAESLFAAGVLADAQSEFAASKGYFEAMLDLCRAGGDTWGVANALNNVAVAALRLGNVGEAAAKHAESLTIWRAMGNDAAVALSLQNLGNIERARGATDEARGRYREALEVFRRVGDERGLALSLQLLADLDRDEQRFEPSAALYEESLEIFIRLTDHWNVANCMADLGRLRYRMGAWREAQELLEESLLIFREVGDRRSGAAVLEDIALVALQQSDQERAEKLAGAAAALRRAVGTEGRLDSRLEALRRSAGPAWREGQSLSFDEAAELAQLSRNV